MKRLLCFALVCILTLGTCILPIIAVPEIPTDSDRYLIDEFYQTVFENYRFFMNQQPGGWSGLSSGSIYGYSESAEKMKNNKHIQPTLDIAHFLIEASWYEVMFGEYDVDDIKLSYYVTALSSLLMTMEDNMGDMKVAQARATASMTWLDYAEKAASAAAAFGGVYSGDVGYKRLETAFEICGIGIDTLGDTINTRQHYEVLALNTETYMTYRTLLQVLKEKSADPLLSEAAGYLMSVIDRNFQYRIEHFRDFGEIVLDMQSNSFFNLLDDMIDGLKKAGLDKDDDYIALAVLAKVTDWVGKFKIGVQIGEIFSDVLFGGSDLMQRYYEIYAMESVRETLISYITSKDAQIKSADDISTIYDVIEFANILNYVNLRGAYCVYRINATDGHLLSLALGAKNAEEWYNSVQRICQDYQEYVSFLIPDVEQYKNHKWDSGTVVDGTFADGEVTMRYTCAKCGETKEERGKAEVVVFNDVNLESVIREIMGKPTGDIYNFEAEKVTEITAYTSDIQNIDALKYFKNLTKLNLNYESIKDISALKELTNLTDLSLGGNQISDISALKGLTNLTHLYLYSNRISDISALKGLTNLTHLDLYSNRISDSSVLKELTNLRWLDLSCNQISNVSA